LITKSLSREMFRKHKWRAEAKSKGKGGKHWEGLSAKALYKSSGFSALVCKRAGGGELAVQTKEMRKNRFQLGNDQSWFG
jgi:hypothetical protein